MKTKFIFLIAALGLTVVTTGRANILITGMVDGTQSGGLPKAMEIVATTNIADISDFWIVRDTNGAGPFDTFIQLPSLALNTGEFFYIYGNSGSTSAMTALGFPATTGNAIEDGILNWNGDDILGLATPNGTFSDGTDISQFDMIDSFGVVGQGDTDFAPDSISYRPNNTPANPAGVTDAGNFNITSYSDTALQNTFGTYVIPEPSVAALLLIGMGFLFRFIRKQK